MSGREPLSVTVITHDEERNLERCLASVAWADEIVVVDSGSTDRTLEIASRHTDRVFRRRWPGYAEQKRFAIERASGPWILSLDADEWLTEEGAREIRDVLTRPRAAAYAIDRRTAFCGAFLGHAWSPDWQVRLFRKGSARVEGGRVHESVRPGRGLPVGRLRCRLPHLAYRSLHEYVRRMNDYTDLAAADLAERGVRRIRLRLLFSPPATFLKLYVVKRGFLDGVRGLVVSAGSAYYALLKYAKAWERTRARDREFSRRVPPTEHDPDPGGTLAGHQ